VGRASSPISVVCRQPSPLWLSKTSPRLPAYSRGIDSTLIPLLLTAASMVVLEKTVAGDVIAALIQALTWLVIGILLRTAVSDDHRDLRRVVGEMDRGLPG
jgi:hypothetical protein